MNHNLILGDCLEVMKSFKDNSITNILTDPPYGLGFMGKEWDKDLPNEQIWKECLRIQKPGGYLLAMGGTRTFHRITCEIEKAGYEIRDCLMWIYGSGFPKSHNFGNSLGNKWEGYGTALKPAWEPIIVAMKPLDGTFKQNAEKWGVAGINIDGCRIPTSNVIGIGTTGVSSKNPGWDRPWKHDKEKLESQRLRHKEALDKTNSLGRWPSNLLLDEEAAGLLDEQTGVLKSGQLKQILHHKQNKIYGKFQRANCNEFASNSGGASRFFYCAKSSPSERNQGLEGMPLKQTTDGYIRSNPESARKYQANSALRLNTHPTVKPLKLMTYLLKLITPPKDGIVLDPFMGSGTTILASKQLGINSIGIEMNPDYYEIAKKRVESYQADSQMNLF